MQIEAEVRSLISDAEAALVGQRTDDPEALLPRVHWMLWRDPDGQAELRGLQKLAATGRIETARSALQKTIDELNEIRAVEDERTVGLDS